MGINNSFLKFPADYFNNSKKILDTALYDLGAYKSWKSFDPGIGHPIDARYRAMPVLTKKIIRENFPNGFVPQGFDIQKGLETGEISFVETSGSTETKVTNIWYQKWWDASERASWKLNNDMSLHATGDHPEAILVNSVNVGYVSDVLELPFEKRRISRFLYLNEKSNPQSWTSGHMNRIIHELSSYKPVILEANPSVLAKLSRYIFESKQSVYQPKAIVLTYENVSNLQLWQIRRVFNVPIISSYGSTETGYVFMQCEEGKFHQNSEYCRVDFQPFKKEHGGPFLGRILVTPFHNDWYYLVRFDVGDLVHVDESQKCSCGRESGLILSTIEGRFTYSTVTCEGRLVSPSELSKHIGIIHEIDEYQLIQVSLNKFEFHLTSHTEDKQKLSEELLSKLKRLYGNEADISIIYENMIPLESSGKFCFSKAQFPLNMEDYLEENYIVKNKN